MLKHRKNLVSIVLIPVSILVPYNITIKEILDELKKFLERNVFENMNDNFLKYFGNDFAKLTGKFWEPLQK